MAIKSLTNLALAALGLAIVWGDSRLLGASGTTELTMLMILGAWERGFLRYLFHHRVMYVSDGRDILSDLSASAMAFVCSFASLLFGAALVVRAHAPLWLGQGVAMAGFTLFWIWFTLALENLNLWVDRGFRPDRELDISGLRRLGSPARK